MSILFGVGNCLVFPFIIVATIFPFVLICLVLASLLLSIFHPLLLLSSLCGLIALWRCYALYRYMEELKEDPLEPLYRRLEVQVTKFVDSSIRWLVPSSIDGIAQGSFEAFILNAARFLFPTNTSYEALLGMIADYQYRVASSQEKESFLYPQLLKWRLIFQFFQALFDEWFEKFREFFGLDDNTN